MIQPNLNNMLQPDLYMFGKPPKPPKKPIIIAIIVFSLFLINKKKLN